MKRTAALTLCALMLLTTVAIAQDAPRYLEVTTVNTPLGHQADYEKAIKALWGAYAKGGTDFPILAFQSISNPGEYNFVSPFDRFEQIDGRNAVTAKILGAAEKVTAELGKHSHSIASSVLATRPDLSYAPSNPRIPAGEEGFARLTYLYPYRAHIGDVENALKEFAAMSAKKDIPDGFGVYADHLTGEGPFFIVRTLAKSEADFYLHAEKNTKAMGQAAIDLRNKVGPMLRKIEYTSGVPRPDLNYLP